MRSVRRPKLIAFKRRRRYSVLLRNVTYVVGIVQQRLATEPTNSLRYFRKNI